MWLDVVGCGWMMLDVVGCGWLMLDVEGVPEYEVARDSSLDPCLSVSLLEGSESPRYWKKD